MVGFLVAHLAGNLLIFGGPEALNGYSEMLHKVPEVLWIMRLGLLAALVVHVYFTALLTHENRAARAVRYEVQADFGRTNFAKRTMILTGLLVFFFLWIHLANFAFAAKEGPHTAVTAAGTQELGLFGLVWNKFLNPVYALFYILAVGCVGFHLSHGIQSLLQTIGFNHERYTPMIRKAAIGAGIALACGFASVPVYVMVKRVPGL